MPLPTYPILATLHGAALVTSSQIPAAILAVASLIKGIEDAKNASEDLRSLAARLHEVSEFLVPALTKADIAANPPLMISVNNTARAMENIGRLVQKQLSQGRLQSFLSASSAKISIKQAQQDLEFSLESVILCLSLSNLRLGTDLNSATLPNLKEQIQAAQEQQLNTIREEVAKAEEERHRFSSQVLPAASAIFYGRDEEINQGLSLLLRPEPTAIAILGPGGMGKTSLALSLIHHEAVIRHYETRRYFVSCEATNSCETVIQRLATALGFGQSHPLGPLKKLVDEVDKPVLITFDNFETPWEYSGQDTKKLENFLVELTSIPKLSIMLTMRGAERPGGVVWSKPFLPPLLPLDIPSAIQVFTSISDTSEDDPYMQQLIIAVDVIPLAVTLLAAQAQYMSCKELLERWSEEKTTMVSRGYEERLSSLDVSIQVSLESSRFKQEASALRLLQLLSILPDGATDAILKQLVPEKFPLGAATATLLRVSLALRDNQDNLRALSPVREHVLSRLPISASDLSNAFGFVRQIAQQFRNLQGQLASFQYRASWASQFGNIRSIMNHCLDRPSDIEPVQSTELILPLWQMFTPNMGVLVMNDLLLEGARVAKEHSLRLQEAKLLLQVDRPQLIDINSALEVFREHKDSESLLRGLAVLGERMHYSDKPDQALRCFEECELIAQDVKSIPVLIEFYGPFASFLAPRYPHRALEVIQHAVDLANSKGLDAYALRFHISLSRGERLRGYYSKCHFYTQTILGCLLEADRSLAATLTHIAGILALQNRGDEAERLFMMSNQIFSQLGRPGDYGATAQILRMTLYLSQNRIDEAALLLKDIRKVVTLGLVDPVLTDLIFELQSNGASDEAGRLVARLFHLHNSKQAELRASSRFLIAEYWIRYGNMEAAASFYMLCTLSSRKQGYRLGVSTSLIRLGDIFRLSEGDMNAALNCYQGAFELIRYIGAPRHLADTLVRMAVAQAYLGDTVSAQKSLSRARSLFEISRFPPGVEYCSEKAEAVGKDPSQEVCLSPDRLPQPTLVGWDDIY